MNKIGDHAVVLGASMSGLLGAAVLADFYDQVTLVERDALGEGAANRRGVPQGRHPHALLARGAQTLEELFPGILDQLAADGAPVWSDGDLSRLHVSFGGHRMVHWGRSPLAEELPGMYQPSRPFLEAHVRQRVSELPNVRMLDHREVLGLTATEDRRRVTGVRISGGRVLPADLVVDAMGRAAHTPAFLESLGYERPPEDHIVVRTTYVSQSLRLPPEALAEEAVLISPARGRPTGMFLGHNENDSWLFTVFGMAGRQPPRGLGGMLAFAEEFAPAHVLAALRFGEPLAPVVQHRLPSSQWRRYDKMRRFPDGLLVTGDAMCSFNPIYGQGMSVAGMEALALRSALRHGDTALSRRYFRAASKSIGVAWRLGAGTDLAFPEVVGRRTPATRLTQRYADWVLRACEQDAAVHAQFMRVTGLVDPPAKLFHPSFVRRVAAVRYLNRSPDPARIESRLRAS